MQREPRLRRDSCFASLLRRTFLLLLVSLRLLLLLPFHSHLRRLLPAKVSSPFLGSRDGTKAKTKRRKEKRKTRLQRERKKEKDKERKTRTTETLLSFFLSAMPNSLFQSRRLRMNHKKNDSLSPTASRYYRHHQLLLRFLLFLPLFLVLPPFRHPVYSCRATPLLSFQQRLGTREGTQGRLRTALSPPAEFEEKRKDRPRHGLFSWLAWTPATEQGA